MKRTSTVETTLFRFVRLALAFAMLLVPFTTTAGAAPVDGPMSPVHDGPVLDVLLPAWAQPPPPAEGPSPGSSDIAPAARQTGLLTDLAPARGLGTNSIAGSTVTGDDCYVPGGMSTLCFTAHNASTDVEWLDEVALAFPAGWAVACNSQDATDSGDNLVFFTCAASGNNVSYTDSDGGFGEVYGGESWGFCVDVTAPGGASGSQAVDWVLSGDDWGSAPHDVGGTLSIGGCVLLDLTPDALEVVGCAGVSQTHTLTLSNDTGAAGTFALSYDVPSGNGTLSGPGGLTLDAGDAQDFDVELSPHACLPKGTEVVATVTASGNGHSDTSTITKTITTLVGWQFRAPMPTARYDLAVVNGGDGGLYAIGGHTGAGDNERYAVATGSWATRAAMPTPVWIVDGGQIGGVIYIPGGYDGTDIVTTAQAYDTAGNAWSNVAAAPRPVAGYAVAACGGLLYRSGGGEIATWSNGTTGLEAYDPVANSWTSLASMSHGHTWHAMACIGGKLYVAGGIDATGDDSTVAEVYDIAANTWSDAAMADLPATWWGAADFQKHGMLSLAGGIKDGATTADVIFYDPVADRWEYGPPLQDARFRLEGDFAVDSGYAEGGMQPLWTAHDSNEYLLQCPECTEVGWLEGRVMDSELGDIVPPCTDPIVHIEPGGLAVSADPIAGYYGPVQLISWTYTLEASAPGFSTGVAVVDVTTDVTATQDFNLWRPVVEVTPTDFISITAPISEEVTYRLTIGNAGHVPLDFEIREGPPAGPLNVPSEPESDDGIEVEPELQAEINAEGVAGYLIYFRERPDLSPAFQMDWHERGWFAMEALQQTAGRSQARVRAYLDARGVDYEAFWIENVIVVESSNRMTVNGLLAYPEIEALRARRHVILYEPEERADVPFNPLAVEPNIGHVGADQVWGMGFTGEGIVVANIDTGVRYTHEALVDQYRGNLGGGIYDHNYNWWDPAPGGSDPVPNDYHGHGSHTMGTMIGDDGAGNQIGMAPGATWIACQALEASDDEVLECGQFMAAPTDLTGANPNPDLRPHVVNNSWGDCLLYADHWYDGVINNWHAMGIYPVFSNGNASNCGYSYPPGCNTVGNPARAGNVTGVGSTGQSDGQYATHSNWGPTDDPDTVNPRGYPNLKPQVLAPGVDIRSSVNSSDSAYASWGGTSMSAPHVAGLVALMWQAAPCLIGDYAATETIIEQTATPIPYESSCGGEGPGDVPNHATGWGEINALAAVQAARDRCELPWVWTDPITGTIPGPGQIGIDVTFHCTEAKDYVGTLRVSHNDPCESPVDVPVVLHCREPVPDPLWDKQVHVNGVPADAVPIVVVPGDTVEIVDRVWVTYTANITFTLVETWTESLELEDWISDAGSVAAVANTLTWDVEDVVPNAWYAITKTFHVLSGPWDADTITESLWVEHAVPQLPDRVLQFSHLAPDIGVAPAALSVMLDPGAVATRALTVDNTGAASLAWNLAEDPARGWLSETPTSGAVAPSEYALVDVVFDTGGLSLGTYTTTLEITSNDPDEPLVSVPVTLEVAEVKYVYLPLVLRNR
jgi:subtilisin family serine protease